MKDAVILLSSDTFMFVVAITIAYRGEKIKRDKAMAQKVADRLLGKKTWTQRQT